MLRTGIKEAVAHVQKNKPKKIKKDALYFKHRFQDKLVDEKVKRNQISIESRQLPGEDPKTLKMPLFDHGVAAPDGKSEYSMVSRQSDERDPEKVKIVHGRWFFETGKDFQPNVQTQGDINMEQKWKKYVAQKKIQKETKKKNDMVLQGISGAQRLKYQEPVEDMLRNLKTQSQRYLGRAVVSEQK